MQLSDFVEIAKLMQRKNNELSIKIYNFENRYNMFKKFDELDAVELHRLIIEKETIEKIECDILKLCDFLLKYNQG